MNYLQLFAKGGKTTNAEIIKGIQSILGVDDAQMAELWQIGLNKYGSEEGIAEAINQATSGLTQNSPQEEVKAAVASVFSTGSEMFKCGGKLQQLVSKFKNGGSVDCGCGGIKVKAEDGTNTRRFNNLPDKVYNENGILIGYMNDPAFMEWLNGRKDNRQFTVTSPTLQARLNNTTNQSKMLWNPERLPESYYVSQILTRSPEGDGMVSHVPTKQLGGLTGYLGSPSNKLKVLNTIMPLLQDGGEVEKHQNANGVIGSSRSKRKDGLFGFVQKDTLANGSTRMILERDDPRTGNTMYTERFIGIPYSTFLNGVQQDTLYRYYQKNGITGKITNTGRYASNWYRARHPFSFRKPIPKEWVERFKKNE